MYDLFVEDGGGTQVSSLHESFIGPWLGGGLSQRAVKGTHHPANRQVQAWLLEGKPGPLALKMVAPARPVREEKGAVEREQVGIHIGEPKWSTEGENL